MGRPQSTQGGRPVVISIRLSVAEKRRLDSLRGSQTPADFFRGLLNGPKK